MTHLTDIRPNTIRRHIKYGYRSRVVGVTKNHYHLISIAALLILGAVMDFVQ